MRLIDADALLEALGKSLIIEHHKNIVDQCEAHIKKYQSMTGFGYEVDQANKRVRLHKKYIDDITKLITTAPTVQRELVIDCRTCANRGVVNGSSQETFFEHCIHGTSWKRNYYEPLTTAPKE